MAEGPRNENGKDTGVAPQKHGDGTMWDYFPQGVLVMLVMQCSCVPRLEEGERIQRIQGRFEKARPGGGRS